MDMANKERSNQQLEEMMKKIDRAGKRLITTRSVEDAKEYKRRIQDYITYVVKNAYVLKKKRDLLTMECIQELK